MKNRGLVFMMMAALLLSAGAVAFAQPGDGPGGMEGDDSGMHGGDGKTEAGPMMRWIQELNLTDDQVAKLKAERFKHQKDGVKLRADMENAHLDLWHEVGSDKPDQVKIDSLTKQIGVLQGEQLANRIASMIYLRSILTPEQRKKMDAMGLGRMESGHHSMMKRPMMEKNKGGK